MEKNKERNKKIFLGVTTLISIILFSVFVLITSFFDNKLHIWFLDVGQGDAILIQTPTKKQILIDGGLSKDTSFLLSKYVPFWDKNIETIFLTHPDADHANGLIEVLKTYEIDNFYSSFSFFDLKDFEKNSEEIGEIKKIIRNKKRKKELKNNELCDLKHTNFDGIEIWIFWPLCEEKVLDDDRNASSLVILIKYADFEALFLGDLPADYQNQLLVANYFSDIEVVKISHHGGKNGTNKSLLEKTKPDLAVISAGKDNKYGHPAEETLKILDDLKINTKRTDKDGTVEIIVDREGYRVVTER